jgi:FKBP-type peptidyl-prolyl cis-trans isomerase
MFSKFELYGAVVSVFFMALALYLIQARLILSQPAPTGDVASEAPGIVAVGQAANVTQARADAFTQAADDSGNIVRMVIDDIKIGVGEPVKEGDVVAVHYQGTLQDGTEFDNSRKRGQEFEFEVGAGQVIEGWDKGLVGMQEGGQRILVIPADMAYGEQGIGPIPGGATLVFAIELVEIK